MTHTTESHRPTDPTNTRAGPIGSSTTRTGEAVSRTNRPTTTAATLPDRYLTPSDLARILGVPVQTLYQWRYRGQGPPGFKVGRHLRYDPVAVRHWVDQQADHERAA
jgi:predicted DNA-binding transcriptional regulator AlpA